MEIRPAAADDRDALYDICVRTGNAGDDARPLYRNHELLGEIWTGPYLELQPDLAFVAEDDAVVVGYVLGAADTRAFEAACEQKWWPPLRARYPDPPADAELTADEALMRRIHHPQPTPDAVVANHPAHLHIDILPRGQGQGIGRQLVVHAARRLAVAWRGGRAPRRRGHEHPRHRVLRPPWISAGRSEQRRKRWRVARHAPLTWHHRAGDQSSRCGAAPGRPRRSAPRSRPDRPGVRATTRRRSAGPRRAHVGRAPQPPVPAGLRRVAVLLPDDPAHRAGDGPASSRRPQRHRRLFRRRLLVARHVQHPLHRAGRRATQRLST